HRAVAGGAQEGARRAPAGRQDHLRQRLRRPRPGPRGLTMSNMVQAIRMALHVAEERHDLTDVFGEDVGPPLRGAFTATQGIKCAWNSPLDERGIVGASIGLGFAGCRNVAEIPFSDYSYNTIEVPKALMRVRSQPGEEIPGEPGDEKALSKMIDAPLGDRSKWQPNWPDTPDLFIPFGEGRTVRRGRDLTVVSYGRTLPLCAKAADALEAEGISAEVIDLRSLYPYDWARVSESVRRTGRVLYVNEDTEITNFGEHLVRRTIDELFYELLAPPRLLAGAFIPGIGLADNLEMASVPQL